MTKKPKLLHGFRVESVDDLSEFRSRGTLYIHEKTGTPVYHMAADDRENLVAFVFKTPPRNDTGVAHILEHSVLCGSRNYPTKDPFLYLYKSSLNTFLNAMTYPDKTVYPTSSVVAKDFYNLIRVYGDAVFFPLLKPEVFAQEGHRLELDESGALIRSGVVYNEMKGNYSSAESVIGDLVLKSVFDQGPYSFDSGGDPRHIPELTYEDFVAFHKENYHPSQSLIFLYGDLPAGPSLKLLEERFLRHFTRKQPAPVIAPQPRWKGPKETLGHYPAAADQENDPGTLALSWLCGDILEQDRVLEWDVLSDVLLGDAGLLQKKILESGLGQDLSPVSGLMNELRDVVFTVGLRGVPESKKKAFQELVLGELKRLVLEGIPADLLESVVASYEFSVREVRGGGMGLRFLSRLRSWLHGATIAEALAFEPRMKALKERLARGEKVFENLIQKGLLENTHRALAVCVPDSQIQKKEEEELKDELAQLRIRAKAEDLEALKRKQVALKTFQETPDRVADIAKMPRLKLSDIPARVEVIDSKWQDFEGVRLAVHEAFTNGVSYLDLGFDLGSLDEKDFLHLPLLQRALDSLGLEDLSYDRLAREIAGTTGGISFRTTADSSFVQEGLVSKFFLRIKMLDEKIPQALSLLQRILTKSDWKNADRMKDLVLEMKNDYQGSLVPRGHLFASLRAAEGFGLPSFVSELTSGLSQLDFLTKLALGKKKDFLRLLDTLKALSARVFQPSRAVGALTGQGRALEDLKAALKPVLKTLSESAAAGETGTGLAMKVFSTAPTIRLIPSTVGFTAHSLRSTRLTDEGHAAELVLSHRLKTGFLWEQIRMKGGAYGAFSFTSGLEGLFTFATYRDPGLNFSYETFRACLQDSQKNLLSRTELENTILGTVSSDLSPRSPSEEGFLFLQRHLLGITDELRQKKRDALRRLKAQDLAEAARKLEAAFDQGRSFVLTGSAIAEEALKNNVFRFQIEERGSTA